MSFEKFDINTTLAAKHQRIKLVELISLRKARNLCIDLPQPIEQMLWIVACKTIERWEKEMETPEEVHAAINYDPKQMCGFDNFGQWETPIKCNECEKCLAETF